MNLLKEATAIYEKQSITKAEDIAKIAFDIINANKTEDVENFLFFCLNRANKIISVNSTTGDIDRCSVYPKQLAKMAILHNATSVMLAHNHPSGNTTPSREDVSITKKIKDGLNLLDITVLDHIIIGTEFYILENKTEYTGFYSFSYEGEI